MALPPDRVDQLLRSLVSFDDLHLENILDDKRGDEMLALDRDTFWCCLSATPTALQRSDRRKCALLLRDLVATADLPHSASFSQQLLDLTHRWWAERADTGIDINDIHHLAAAVHIHTKLHPERYPDPAPFQLPDPRQPARSLTDLLTVLVAILGRRQPLNVPPLHSARTVTEVVAEEYRILESVNCELGTYTQGDWVKLFEVRFSVRA